MAGPRLRNTTKHVAALNPIHEEPEHEESGEYAQCNTKGGTHGGRPSLVDGFRFATTTKHVAASNLLGGIPDAKQSKLYPDH